MPIFQLSIINAAASPPQQLLTKSRKTGIPPTIYHLQYSCFPFSVLLVIYTAAVTPLNAAFCSTVAEILVIFSRILVLQRTLIALFKYPPVFDIIKGGGYYDDKYSIRPTAIRTVGS